MYIKLIVLFVMVSLSANTWAQVGGIETEEVEVIKSFEATLKDAEKVKIKPILPSLVPIEKKYRYKVTIVPLEIQYPEPIIKPQAVIPDAPFKQSNFFLKGGYGSLENPSGQLYYGNQIRDKYTIDIGANYEGMSQGTYDDQAYQLADVDLRLSRRIGENNKLSLDAYTGLYARDNYFTIGDNPPLDKSEFQNFGGRLIFENLETFVKKPFYKVGIFYDYTDITVTNNMQQDYIGGFVDIGSQINKHFSFSIPVGYTHTNTISNESQTQDLLEARPSINYTKSKLKINVGVGYVDAGQDESYLWPIGNITYALGGKYVSPFIQSSLNVRQNNLKNVGREYGWINTPFLSTQVTEEVSGGILGELGFLSYNAEAGYRNFNNILDFVHDRLPLYNLSGNLKTTSGAFFRGSLDMALSEKSIIGGEITQNFITELDYIPTLELNAYAKFYLFKDKLILSPSLNISDAVTATGPALANDVNLNEQIELNGDIEFWPTKKFGIYGQAVNLLNNNYQRWYGFPVPGIHFNGGILVKF